MAAIGLVFGASQTGVAARMADAGTEGLTGPVYALMGVGSAVAGLLTTRLPRGFGLASRIAVGGALLVVGGLLVAAAGPAYLLAPALLFLGLALAPALVSAYALAERAAPAGWGTTMMTALATANVVGVAAGAAVAGLLVDRVSPAAALLVVAVAGVLVLVGGLGARARPHRVGCRRTRPAWSFPRNCGRMTAAAGQPTRSHPRRGRWLPSCTSSRER